MIKWLILAFVLISASAYISSSILNSVNDPVFCGDCHEKEYNNYTTPLINSDMPVHKENEITCLDCHSSKTSIWSDIATKKFLIKAKIINSSLPAINGLFRSNFTFNETFNISQFSMLQPDCTKCHNTTNIISILFNHSNASTCQNCHLLHKEPEKPENPFWKRMGEGGHKNRTCGDCHGTEPTQLGDLPQCTKCHTPHLKDAEWDRSTCLGCHDNPHIPQKNAVFKGTITKEMCSACHNNIYQILTVYDSKHNQKVPSCINCHPKHRKVKSCGIDAGCHTPHGPLHSGSKCSSCHGYVNTCTDCHTNPHAPLSGLPIATGEALNALAKQGGVRK